MINYKPTQEIIDLFKRIGSKNLQESFDAQLILCDALQPIINADIFANKTLVDCGLGIDITTRVDCDKKYAKDCRMDILLRIIEILISNAKHKIELYKCYKDCMLVPDKDINVLDRFGMVLHILVVE